ncbi:MAG: hypothetical protein WA323_01710 [Candidatus Nitrosopolaris sp.]
MGVLTTIYSQKAFALVVTGGNGGDCSASSSTSCNGIQGPAAGNGGIVTSGNGGNGANANGGHAMNKNGQSHHVVT